MTGDWRDRLPLNATVLSGDPGTAQCPACGQRRIIYQAHFFKEAVVVAACKACLTERAGGEEKIIARHVPELRGLGRLWETDRRDPALAARLSSQKRSASPG